MKARLALWLVLVSGGAVAAGIALPQTAAVAQSAFATDSPTTPPNATPDGPATPKPTLENAPAVDAAALAPYKLSGSGSMTGKISISTGEGDDIPPVGYPVYLVPNTPYTAWYVSYHEFELRDAIHRNPTKSPGGGLRGMMMRNVLKKYGLNGLPDETAAVPFTPMDSTAFHVVRTARTTTGGYYSFTGLPPGSYFVLAHWPVKFTKSVTITHGQEGFFGDYNGESAEQRSANYYLLWFDATKPIAVGPHQAVKFVPMQATAALGGTNCGPYKCGRMLIDQWLTIDERS